eukprot:gene8694-6115_t
MANAPEEEDLYAVFDAPQLDANPWAPPTNPTVGAANPFAAAPPLSSGGNPIVQAPPSQWGAAGGLGTAWGAPGSRIGTMGGRNTAGAARPMTSNRGVGFNAQAGLFDQGRMTIGPAPPLKMRSENSPEEQCMENERLVNRLIEESAMLAAQKNFSEALDKAKEAGKKERQLCKQREDLNLSEQINVELTFAVHFNLAVQFQNHELYMEALNAYNLIVRNSQFPQATRLRVNIGNIYGAQKKYLLAIKMYRLALDETPPSDKELRYKLYRNIGNAFVRMGQYRDAVNSYETILEGSGDVSAGFNLVLCYYALGETEKMKRTFIKMLHSRPAGLEDEEDFEEEEQRKDVLVDDGLRSALKERRANFLHCIMTAARLIAPALDKDWRVGYDYLIDQLRQYEMRDPSSRVASELEMCKCLHYLKHKRYQDAISGLKAFEKKDKTLQARAATNLAYLYFLEGDYESGEKYSDMSIEVDQYNAKALVNKGNFLFIKGELETATDYYHKALSVEADNMEALYNIGLASKRLGRYEEAIKLFKRVGVLVMSNEVLYQIADLHDLMGDPSALESFSRLIGRVPTDPGALARIGSLYARRGDDTQAFHYYLEAFRYYQVNMDVISWLGAYFVANEVYDKAIQFFERSSQIEPNEVKWQLMVASCHRRRGEYLVAKRLYEQIHRKYPENVECLRYLVQLCKDGGLADEANEWLEVMNKVERKRAASDSDEDEQNKGSEDKKAVAGRRAGGAVSAAADFERKEPKTKKAPKPEEEAELQLPGLSRTACKRLPPHRRRSTKENQLALSLMVLNGPALLCNSPIYACSVPPYAPGYPLPQTVVSDEVNDLVKDADGNREGEHDGSLEAAAFRIRRPFFWYFFFMSECVLWLLSEDKQTKSDENAKIEGEWVDFFGLAALPRPLYEMSHFYWEELEAEKNGSYCCSMCLSEAGEAPTPFQFQKLPSVLYSAKLCYTAVRATLLMLLRLKGHSSFLFLSEDYLHSWCTLPFAMSGSEDDWYGYGDSGDESGTCVSSHSTSVSVMSVEEASTSKLLDPTILDRRAVLVDAQTLLGVNSESNYLSVPVAPNHVVEVALKAVRYPLSMSNYEVQVEKTLLHQPTLKESMSKLFLSVTCETARLQAEMVHGVVPYSTSFGVVERSAKYLFDTVAEDYKENEKFSFVWGHRWADVAELSPLTTAMQAVFDSLGEGPKAFLTAQSRLAEVKESFKIMERYGLQTGTYEVFAYEEMAGGAKFLSGVPEFPCPLHTVLQGNTHCCCTTVHQLELALRSAAAELEKLRANTFSIKDNQTEHAGAEMLLNLSGRRLEGEGEGEGHYCLYPLSIRTPLFFYLTENKINTQSSPSSLLLLLFFPVGRFILRIMSDSDWDYDASDTESQAINAESLVTSSEEALDDLVERIVEATESTLNECAILVDAQTLMGASPKDEIVSRASTLNPVVEIAFKVVRNPLSVPHFKTISDKTLLQQPTFLGAISRFTRDVSNSTALERAVSVHGIVPVSSLQDNVAKSAIERFQKVYSSKPKGATLILEKKEKGRLCEEVTRVLASVGNKPKAFLTREDRVREVEEAFSVLQKGGVNFGVYKIFSYERVAAGPKFIVPTEQRRCPLHDGKEYNSHIHCCQTTVFQMDSALRRAAQALKEAHKC